MFGYTRHDSMTGVLLELSLPAGYYCSWFSCSFCTFLLLLLCIFYCIFIDLCVWNKPGLIDLYKLLLSSTSLSAKAFSIHAPLVWNLVSYDCRSAKLLCTLKLNC